MKSRVLTGAPSLGLSRSAGGASSGVSAARRRGSGSLDRDHRRPQHPVAAAVTLPQHGRRGRDADVGRGVVDDRLVHRRVERVAGRAERLTPSPSSRPRTPVGDQLEAAGQLAVVPGPLDVVDDREQLDGEPLGRLVDDQRPGRGRPACGSWRTRP